VSGSPAWSSGWLMATATATATRSSEVLARLRTESRWLGPLLALVALAAQIPFTMLLTSAIGYLVISGSTYGTEGIYLEQAVTAGIALVVMGLGIVAICLVSYGLTARATAAAVTIVLGLGVTALADLRAEQALYPFASELDARIKGFEPPPGARLSRTERSSGRAVRQWTVPGTIGEACLQAEDAFRRWTGPDIGERGDPLCGHAAVMGDDKISIQVSGHPGEGASDLIVTVDRSW
jgi:hypothetical protein